jgi:hypothetical protein
VSHDSPNQHLIRARVILVKDGFVQTRIEGFADAPELLDSPAPQALLDAAPTESNTAHPWIVSERLGYLCERPVQIVEEWQKLAHEGDALLLSVHEPLLLGSAFEAQEVRPLAAEQLQQLPSVACSTA